MIDSTRDSWDLHWREYAGSAQLNPAQQYRRQLIFSELQLGGAARVLDIGSGQGDFAADTLSRYPDSTVLGLDLSATGVSLASRKVPSAVFVQRDLLLPGDAGPHRNWATHAVCSEVLEHVDDPERLLRNAADYMTEGCRLVVTVPGGPMSAFDRHIGHRRHFSADDLRRLMVKAGFAVEAATGAGFPFFNLYRTLVILRGRRLIRDVAESEGTPGTGLARLAMTFFDRTLGWSSTKSGWQILAVGRKRAPQ